MYYLDIYLNDMISLETFLELSTILSFIKNLVHVVNFTIILK